MSKKNKSLAEKLSHIFTPLDSFDVNILPTEKEVICRYIALFDFEVNSNSHHKHNYEAEKSSISKLATELIEIWEKHGISKLQKGVEDKLRLRFIPRFKNAFVKTPPKSEKLIDQKLKKFSLSEVFMLSESPAKRMREDSANEYDNGKKMISDFIPKKSVSARHNMSNLY